MLLPEAPQFLSQFVDLSSPAVQCVSDPGVLALTEAKPLCCIADYDGRHGLEASVHFSLVDGFQDLAYVCVKLCPCCLAAGWRPLDPLLTDYPAAVQRLHCFEVFGTVGCFLAGLRLRLTRTRSCALQHVPLLPTFHPSQMYLPVT